MKKIKLKYPLVWYPVSIVVEVAFLYCLYALLAYDFETFYRNVFWWAVLTSIVLTVITERMMVVKKKE